MLSIQNISPPSLSEDEDKSNQQGMIQGENDSKHLKETARANADSIEDCEDVTPTQIIPLESAPHENSVNVDNVVTNCDDTEVITNKPSHNERIQDDMTSQLTNFGSKPPFEDKVNKNGVSEDIPTKIKGNEGILLNNTHVKKNFDEVVDQFKRALQSPMNVKSEIQIDPNDNVITRDKADESIEVDYNNTTQNNIGPREKSNDSLVDSSNAGDKLVQCPVDGNVANNIKDENEIKYCGRGLPSQEQMDMLNESANVATLTNVSDSSDEESLPKRSRQFTFSDSDLPNDDEIKEILMMYPKPPFIESFSESESENSSNDESNRPICRRRRDKPEPLDLTKILDILPEKVLTRLRKPPARFGFEDMTQNSSVLKPTYLREQEDEIDEDIIAVNIRRLKTFGKRNTNKDLKKLKEIKKRSLLKKAVNKSNKRKKNIKVKPKIKNAKSKSKSNARKSAELKIKNTKDSLVSTSATETTNARTRSMKKQNDGKNTAKRCILLGNRIKKTNSKQKLTNMKERSRLAENKVRRSKRQQRFIQKSDGTMKVPTHILKKSIHEQSTVIHISSSSSKSPKSLKRSLVDDSDVPSPKRTRFQNTNNNQELNNNNSTAKKTQQGHLTVIHSKELQQDKRCPYVYLERYDPQKLTRMLKSNRNSLNTNTQTQTRVLSHNRNSLNINTQSQIRLLSRNRNSLNMDTQSQTRTLNRNRNTNTQTQTRVLSRNRNSLNINTQSQTRTLNSNRNSWDMNTQSQARTLNRNRNSLNMNTQSQTKVLSRNRNSLNTNTQSQTRTLNRNRNSLNMNTQSQTKVLSRNRNSLNMNTQSQTRTLNRNRNSLNKNTQSHTRTLNRNRNSLNMKTRTQSARRR